jgi:hypothetical protein
MTLTPEQLAGLSVMRKERGDDPNKDPNKRGRGSKEVASLISLVKSIKALMTTVKRAIRKVTFSKDEESGAMEEASDSSDDDDGKVAKKQEATSKNCGNPALKRKQGCEQVNIASGDGPKGDDIDSDSIRLDWQCVFWSRFEQNSICSRFEQNLTSSMPLQEQLGMAAIVLQDDECKLAPIRSVKIGNVYLTSDLVGV